MRIYYIFLSTQTIFVFLQAYNDWLCENKADNLIDGLNFDNNQLFFIAFAQVR